MTKQFFKDLPDTSTPLTASRLNGLLDGEEAMGNLVVDSIRSKNMWRPIVDAKQVRCSVTINNGVYSFVASDSDMYFGEVTTTGNSWIYERGYLYPVEPNTKYTLSVSNTLFTKNLVTQYNSSKVSLGYSNLKSNVKTFTTSSDCRYVSLRIGYEAATSGTTYTTTIQLEKGDTATTYYPYQNLDSLASNGILASMTTSNTTMTQTITEYTQLNLVQILQVGNFFEIDSGGIKCLRDGVIEVSANIHLQSVTSGTDVRWLELIHGAQTQMAVIPSVVSGRTTLTCPPIIYEVSAGDIIYLKYDGVNGDVVRGNKQYTNVYTKYIS